MIGEAMKRSQRIFGAVTVIALLLSFSAIFVSSAQNEPVLSFDVALTSPIYSPISSSGPTEADNKAFKELVSATAFPPFYALIRDLPDITCWMTALKLTPKYDIIVRQGTRRYFELKGVTCGIIPYSSYTDPKGMVEKIREKVDSFVPDGETMYDKLLSIHDFVTSSTTYMSDTEGALFCYSAYGALVDGKAVCEGYAEAFKLLCDREGLPCLTVVGTGNGGAHKWNMVQMEDGEWYTLDATWDDQASNIYYSYFIIGSNTKAPYFNNGTAVDSTVHIATGQIFSGANTVLTYPTLSKDTYGVGILKSGAPDVQFDTVRNVIMVGKDVTNYYTYVVNNSTSGFSRTRNGSGTTTSTLTVSDSTTTKVYLVAMRGDIDASNDVDVDDYTAMTQACATTYKVDNGTAKFYAGDMNQDGAVDGFDVIALDLYANGDLLYN
jgi:hypothetical protein